MVHGAVRYLFHCIAGLAFVILVGLGLLLWRLERGPLSLQAALPYVVDALNESLDPYRLDMDTLSLAWKGGNRSLYLRALGLRMKAADGSLIASMPEVALQVSPRALWLGKVRLRSVEIVHPFLSLQQDEEGMTSSERVARKSDGVDPKALFDSYARGMAAAFTKALADGPLSEVTRVRVEGAKALIHDRHLEEAWTIPSAELDLRRSGNGTVGLRVNLEVARASPAEVLGPSEQGSVPTTSHLSITGTYYQPHRTLSLTFHMEGLRAAPLASLSDTLAPLAALDMPLSGQVGVDLRLGTTPVAVSVVRINLRGTEGALILPEGHGGMRYPVRHVALIADITAQEGQNLLQRNHGVASVVVKRLVVALQGKADSTVSAQGTLLRRGEQGYEGTLALAVKDIPVSMVRRWWPRGMAPSPRAWVTQHVREGHIQEGRWDIVLRGQTPRLLAPEALSGHLHAEGVTVDYLPPMPAVQHGTVDVDFAVDRLVVTFNGGTVRQAGVDPLSLSGGSVVMTGLNTQNPMTDIRLSIDGTVPAALTFLDHEPLQYAQRLGLAPTQTGGQAQITVRLQFPPLATLRLGQIAVDARARITNAVLRKGVFGQDLTHGVLTLHVGNSQLEGTGSAQLGGVPVDFTWQEIFSGVPYRSRYHVRTQVSEDKRSLFGLTFAPFTPRYIRGTVPADLELTVKTDKTMVLAVKADLSATTMHIPGFNWSKKAGVKARASATVHVTDDTVTSVPHFSLRASQTLALDGRIDLNAQGDVQSLMLDQATIGLSTFAGTATRRGSGYDVTIHGAAFDLAPFLGGRRSASPPLISQPRVSASGTSDSGATIPPGAVLDETAPEGHGPYQSLDDYIREESIETLPPITLRARFDTVWLSDDGTIQSVQGVARRVKGRWLWADVTAKVDGAAPLSYHLGPRQEGDIVPGQRQFRMHTTDTGGLLRALGWLDTMSGGPLTGQGVVAPDGKTDGVLEVGPYRLRDVPVLAQILSVAALTGILDALRGEGIGFESATIPFMLSEDALVLHDVRTSGSALGLTASGRVHLARKAFDVAGTIVPAYAVNGLLGKLPLVGRLLSGFTEGGGLFAATYSMKGPISNPNILVNPLSVFTPGILRRIFGMGEPDESVRAGTSGPAPDEATKNGSLPPSPTTGR